MVQPIVSVDNHPIPADEVLLTPRVTTEYFPNLPFVLRLRSREPLSCLEGPGSYKYLHRIVFVGHMEGSPLEGYFMGRSTWGPSPARPWPLFEYEYVCSLQR